MMPLLRKISFLLLYIISFSCKTRLERQGWQRMVVVSQLDISTINKKEKELFVVKIQNFPHTDSTGKIIYNPFLIPNEPRYVFNVFVKDSAGKIINEPFPVLPNYRSKSDIAYYKWQSDSLCFIKILNHGNVKTSFELKYTSSPWSRSLRPLDESKK